MKQLIVNADDFGLTPGVNRAIVELNRRGILTSTTLMANADAAEGAVSLARQAPGLAVGCHIVLVDGAPVLPPAKLLTLVDQKTGRFRPALGQFVRDLFLGKIRASEIEAEAEAQIALIRALGVSPTHLDTHKHAHMFPRVLAPLLRAANRQRIMAIRNPFEPRWSWNATAGAPLTRRIQVRLLDHFRPGFRRMVASSGLATTDGALGVLATGTLNASTLAALLNEMPDGAWELVTHPGYNDAQLSNARTRLLASRETELAALMDLPLPLDTELIHFGQIAPSQRNSTRASTH